VAGAGILELEDERGCRARNSGIARGLWFFGEDHSEEQDVDHDNARKTEDDDKHARDQGNEGDRSADECSARYLSTRYESACDKPSGNCSACNFVARDASTRRWRDRPVQRRHLLIRGASSRCVFAARWCRAVLQVAQIGCERRSSYSSSSSGAVAGSRYTPIGCHAFSKSRNSRPSRSVGLYLPTEEGLDRQRWTNREELRVAIVIRIERTYDGRRRRRALGRLTRIEYEILTTTARAA